jgi:hypothetical protein
MTKAQQKRLLSLVQAVLMARRNGYPKKEEAAMGRLFTFCSQHAVDPKEAMEQGETWLRRHAIAVNMNGLI